MYTIQTLREAVHILSTSPLWVRYSVAIKSRMARELAAILYTGQTAQ